MPFPKILAPLLPRKRSKGLQENKASKAVAKEFILSPAALPLSPPTQQDATVAMNDNGDPIIELATTYEESSNCSQETLTETNEKEEVTENALVLHEKPTAFELCDNDLIIESVKDTENEQEQEDIFNSEMKRDNTGLPTTTTNETDTCADPNTDADADVNTTATDNTTTAVTTFNAPEIDFAPPAEFMNKEDDINPFDAPLTVTEETIEPAMVALPPSPPVAALKNQIEETQTEFTAPIQAEPTQTALIQIEPAQVQITQPAVQSEFIQPQADFIKTVQTEQVPNVFVTTPAEPEANFAMETTFHKTDTVKSKWLKMLSSAKILVCKPDRAEDEDNNRIKALFDSKYECNLSAAGQESSNDCKEEVKDKFVSAYDKQAEEDAKTPIYRRRNTSHTSLFQMEDSEPVQPYKSPVIGSDAYNIKLLCDQSFFGRW